MPRKPNVSAHGMIALFVVMVIGPIIWWSRQAPRDNTQQLSGMWIHEEAFDPQALTQSGLRVNELEPVYLIEGDRMVMQIGGEEAGRYRLVIDPRQDPKTFDLIAAEKPGGRMVESILAGHHVLIPSKGIYRLEGNRLTICQAAENGARPPSFSRGTRGENLVYQLLRLGDAEVPPLDE